MTTDAELFSLLSQVMTKYEEVRGLESKLTQVRAERDELVTAAIATERIDARGIALFCRARGKERRGGGRAHAVREPTPNWSPLLSSADIARLAGVTRATVTNWKKRHADFPPPADAARPPRYAREKVFEYLDRHGIDHA